MTRRTTTTTTSPDRAELVAAIGAKIAALKARDHALLGRQLELEQDGVRPIAPRPEPDVRRAARELLNGFAGSPDPAGSDGEQLHAVIFEREAIDQALTMLSSQQLQARVIALAEILRDSGESWHEIVRERCEAIFALRRANARARRFREALAAKAGVDFSLPADRSFGIFADPAIVSDAAYNFLADAVRLGVVSQKEIADASK